MLKYKYDTHALERQVEKVCISFVCCTFNPQTRKKKRVCTARSGLTNCAFLQTWKYLCLFSTFSDKNKAVPPFYIYCSFKFYHRRQTTLEQFKIESNPS